MRYVFGISVIAICLMIGCGRRGTNQVTWVESDIAVSGAEVSLGYRTGTSGDSKQMIPVAKLADSNGPLASAMVFATLLDADGTPLGSEMPTRFESTGSADEQVYLAEGLSFDGSASSIRFRIVTADGEAIHEIAIGKQGA